jgi:hypothetical protein
VISIFIWLFLCIEAGSGAVTCSPFLGHPKLEFSGVRAQGAASAAEPETSDIGVLIST